MIKKAVLTTIAALTLGTHAGYAENFSDRAPEIKPTAANGQSVLVDNTHGQTAGAAD